MSSALAEVRVAVTRAACQSDSIAEAIRRHGGVVLELPCIAFEDPESSTELDAALVDLNVRYDGILFTSRNAVDRTLARCSSSAMAGLTVAVAGTATADALRGHGIEADVVPESFRSEGLLEALDGFAELQLPNTRWLLPRAEVAREVLPQGLRDRGARVDVVTAYRTVQPANGALVRQSLSAGIDVLTFASGSAVTNFRSLVGDPFEQLVRGVKVASIGPVTSAASARAGLVVDIEAPVARTGALIEALAQWWMERP